MGIHQGAHILFIADKVKVLCPNAWFLVTALARQDEVMMKQAPLVVPEGVDISKLQNSVAKR